MPRTKIATRSGHPSSNGLIPVLFVLRFPHVSTCHTFDVRILHSVCFSHFVMVGWMPLWWVQNPPKKYPQPMLTQGLVQEILSNPEMSEIPLVWKEMVQRQKGCTEELWLFVRWRKLKLCLACCTTRITGDYSSLYLGSPVPATSCHTEGCRARESWDDGRVGSVEDLWSIITMDRFKSSVWILPSGVWYGMGVVIPAWVLVIFLW